MDLNRHLSQEDAEMANKYIVKGIQIKTTMRYHFISISHPQAIFKAMALKKKRKKNKC